MQKIKLVALGIFLFLLVSCSYIAQYDDKEVAATVNDVDITVGELRFLYADQDALDYVKSWVRTEVVKQEVNKRNLDISYYLRGDDDPFRKLPSADTKDTDNKQVRKFAEKQAKKFDLTPEHFQEKYAQKLDEQSAYLLTYLHDELDLPPDEFLKEKDISNPESTEILSDLMDDYDENIEIFIE